MSFNLTGHEQDKRMMQDKERLRRAEEELLNKLKFTPGSEVGGMPYQSDRLDKLFEMQGKFMEYLNQGKLRNTYDQDMTTMCLAVMSETQEILQLINWKPWKGHKPHDMPKIQEEIIDLFHFVLELMIHSKMSPQELFEGYKAKMAVNVNRQIGGY